MKTHIIAMALTLAALQAGGKAITMHRTIEAEWLSADCGNIKDTEFEK